MQEFKDIKSPEENNKTSNNTVASEKSKKRLISKNFSRKKLQWGLVVLVALVALAIAGVFLVKYNNSQKEIKNSQEEIKRLSNPKEAAKIEAEILKERVAKLVELPKGEEPTIATVTDATKLK